MPGFDRHSHADLAKRLETASALDMVNFAAALNRSEPDRVSTSFPIAGGHAVLCGQGMFVNLALAAGIDRPPTTAELEQLIDVSNDVGVTPTFEMSELSHPATEHVLHASGFAPEDDKTAGLVWPFDGRSDTASAAEAFDISVVNDAAALADWQEAAAIGWGHVTQDRRSASDAFGAGAFATQTPGLLLARDPSDQRIVGCASLSVRDGVAILGGMSTIPSERSRGVQTALVQHRLAVAATLNCNIAGTQADLSGGSFRNLVRAGFVHSHTKVAWIRI